MTELAAERETVLRGPIAAPVQPAPRLRGTLAAPLPLPPDLRRSRPSRRRPIAVLFALATALYLVDLFTKIVAVALLDEESPVAVPGTGVTLRLIRNPGAAFGLGVEVTAVFTIITVAVIVAILAAACRLGSMRWALALGLLLGGALGNLTDRLARAPGPPNGHVIDFVEIPGWPIFNVADASIGVAGLLIVVLALRNIPVAGRSRVA